MDSRGLAIRNPITMLPKFRTPGLSRARRALYYYLLCKQILKAASKALSYEPMRNLLAEDFIKRFLF